MRLPPSPVDARDAGLSVDDLPFFFDEAHRAIADVIRRVVREIIAIEAQGLDASATARATVSALGRAGLLAMLTDAETFDLRTVCLVREGLAWASGSADSLFAVQGLGTYPIARFGTAAQRDRWLPSASRGESIAAFALTEVEAGTDAASVRTSARRDGDGWVLDGEKVFISNAPVASHAIVFARTGETSPHRAKTAAFIVDCTSAGVAVTGPTPLVADHSIGTITFSGCRVPNDALLGDDGQGFSIAMATLDTFRVSVGAAAVGMARRALDEATARAASRTQFGKAIGDFQLVAAHLADSAVELDAARLLVLRAAFARDRGATSITKEAAVAKLFATEAAQRIIDRAVQVHGGLGVARGVTVERLYREVRPLRIYEGTSEIQRVIIGKHLLTAERGR